MSDDDNIKDPEALPRVDCSGRGYHWHADTRALDYYFEVEGAATDEDGNPCSAGARLRLEECGKVPTAERCEEQVAAVEKSGLYGLPARGITKAEYDAEYSDESNSQNTNVARESGDQTT